MIKRIGTYKSINDRLEEIKKYNQKDEEVAKFVKALQEHDRVIVYCDADEFPHVDFLTNSSIMNECERLLGEDYKVIYVWGHMASYRDVCYLIYGVVDDMSPYIVLLKNGIELVRSDETFLSSSSLKDVHDAPMKLTNWIKEQFKYKNEIV
jgi:hypothetical protein